MGSSNVLFVKIIAGDNETVLIDKKATETSQRIKMLMNICNYDKDGLPVIPIYKLSGNLLRKILEWTDYHKYDVYSPLQYDDLTGDVCEWDLKYFDVSQSALCDILWAANYLEIPPLWKACCKYVGKLIKSRSTGNYSMERSLQRQSDDNWPTMN